MGGLWSVSLKHLYNSQDAKIITLQMPIAAAGADLLHFKVGIKNDRPASRCSCVSPLAGD